MRNWQESCRFAMCTWSSYRGAHIWWGQDLVDFTCAQGGGHVLWAPPVSHNSVVPTPTLILKLSTTHTDAGPPWTDRSTVSPMPLAQRHTSTVSGPLLYCDFAEAIIAILGIRGKVFRVIYLESEARILVRGVFVKFFFIKTGIE